MLINTDDLGWQVSYTMTGGDGWTIPYGLYECDGYGATYGKAIEPFDLGKYDKEIKCDAIEELYSYLYEKLYADEINQNQIMNVIDRYLRKLRGWEND